MTPSDALRDLVASVEQALPQARQSIDWLGNPGRWYAVEASAWVAILRALTAAQAALLETSWQSGIEWIRVPKKQWDEAIDLHARLAAVLVIEGEAVVDAIAAFGRARWKAGVRDGNRQGTLGEWCDECDRPQYVLPDGEHVCGSAGEVYHHGYQAGVQAERARWADERAKWSAFHDACLRDHQDALRGQGEET